MAYNLAINKSKMEELFKSTYIEIQNDIIGVKKKNRRITIWISMDMWRFLSDGMFIEEPKHGDCSLCGMLMGVDSQLNTFDYYIKFEPSR